MKLLFTTLLLLSALQKNDLSRENLKGKVRSKKEEQFQVYNAGSDSSKAVSLLKSLNYYNENGYLIEAIQYNDHPSKDSIRKYEYKYDDSGNKIERLHYWGEGELIGKTTYINGKYGILEERVYNLNSTSYYLGTFEYDNPGNMIISKSYSLKGVAIDSVIYKYDKKGNTIETNSSTHRGRIEKMAYDSLGNQIEKDYYNSKGNLEKKYLYEFDSKNICIKVETHNANDSVIDKTISKHTFDKMDNWIVDSIFDGGILTHVTTREIQYY